MHGTYFDAIILYLMSTIVSYKITLGQIGDIAKQRLPKCPYYKIILEQIAHKYMQEDATSKKFRVFKFNSLKWLMVDLL